MPGLWDSQRTPDLSAHNQCAHRPGLSALHCIFALQHFVDRAQANGQQLYICFLKFRVPMIGFRKIGMAIVATPWGAWINALSCAVPVKINRLTNNINGRAAESCIVHSDTGVNQGCPSSLPPMDSTSMARAVSLCILGLLVCLYIPLESSRVQVTELAYADDVTLMALSP